MCRHVGQVRVRGKWANGYVCLCFRVRVFLCEPARVRAGDETNHFWKTFMSPEVNIRVLRGAASIHPVGELDKSI